MPPKKRKTAGDEFKCGDCERSFFDLDNFIQHKKQCKDTADAEEPDEEDPGQPSTPEPPKKRGRPSKADLAERERRREEERKVAEAQGGCRKCDGCSRTEDCRRCVPCQRKTGGGAQDEICIMRKCEMLTDDSDVFKAIGDPNLEEKAEPGPSSGSRPRKQRQSKAACTDFLKRLSTSMRSGVTMPVLNRDDETSRRSIPSILQRKRKPVQPAAATTPTQTLATPLNQSTIAAVVESGQQVLIVNSDQLSLLQNSQGIVVMQSDPKTLQVEVVRLNDENDATQASDGGASEKQAEMVDEEEDVDDDGDEEYEPDQPVKPQTGKPFTRLNSSLDQSSSQRLSNTSRVQDGLTAEQRRIMARKKGRSRLFNNPKPRKNRIFVVAEDGVTIEIVGNASTDRAKAVEKADEKMPYVREKMALMCNSQNQPQEQNADEEQAQDKGNASVKKDLTRFDALKKKPVVATSPATVITLEDCTADFVDMNSMQKLPNQVQLIESDLPLREAENLEGLQGNYLFRQIHSSQEPMRCLFCRDKFTFKFLIDLEKHYHVIHEIQAVPAKAEFSDNAVFICLPDDVTEETLLKSACQFCSATLRTLSEVREHYTTMHERTIRHVFEGQLSNLSQVFYCSMCNFPSTCFEQHHEHMKSVHHRMTFVCKYCNYCTPRPGRLKAHVKQRHLDGQPGPHLQCTVCSVYVHGKERLMKHVLLSHAVQTGPSLWSCAKCLEPTVSHDDLLVHIAKCPDLQRKDGKKTPANLMFKCFHCEQVFSEKEEVEKHMIDGKCLQEYAENDDEGLDESATSCFLCNMTLKNSDVANQHLHHVHMKWVKRTVRSADEVPEVTTQICPLNDTTEIIMDPSAMLERNEVPSDSRLNALGFPNKVGHYCHLCDVVIKNYTLFYLHMHNLHGMQKRFICIVTSCSNTFEDVAAFQAHCKIHNQRGEHFCAMCDMVFDSAEDLQEHFVSAQHATQHMKIQDKHNRTEPRNYRCRVCHTWHGLLSTFVRHMETESHQYQCQHCGQLFVQPAPRRNHIQNAHPEMANICEICGAKASSAQALWSHLSQHSVVHECNKCHRRFLQNEQLVAHMELHAPPTPCPWTNCNRRLSTKVGLYNHLRLHRGDCDYKCPICERGFFKKKSLDIHMKSHEPGSSQNPAGASLLSSRSFLKHRQGAGGGPLEVRLICSGCLKGFDHEADFESHECNSSDQVIVDANGQPIQQIQSGETGEEDAVYITEPTSALMNPESLVSIRKDLDQGVATISVREGSGQLSLEVEGGRDGINEIDENIALQLVRAAGGDDVTHLQVEDNGRTTQYKILKCPTCEKGFFKEKSLDAHIKTHVQIEPPAATMAAPRNYIKHQSGTQEVRLYCSGCLKGFENEADFETHECMTADQLIVDNSNQAIQHLQPGDQVPEDGTIYMTDQGPVVLGQEGVVSIKRDIGRGVAVISMSGGNTHFSLEVEGGKDGINEIDDNIAIQLLRAAGGDDVTHLQVEDNGRTTQYKILEYKELPLDEAVLIQEGSDQSRI